MVNKYLSIRKNTERICAHLTEHELSIQPRIEVSPAKWHLGHTSWFFEKMILEKYFKNYQCFNTEYSFLFNSYYKQIGKHISQCDRGDISIATEEILKYRKHIDQKIIELLQTENDQDMINLLIVGLNHEEQHQELLHMDIKSVFFSLNKEYPLKFERQTGHEKRWIKIPEGIIECGDNHQGFAFDNERPLHKSYQYKARLSQSLVSNSDYSEFIKDGGYSNSQFWLSKGWEWVNINKITEPLYWNDSLNPLDAVAHISYFEADAYANWVGCRLPTEFEHEYFDQINKSSSVLWSWTSSQYSPYPGFKKFDGALSEYNGKFMCNQFVLRGGCIATPAGHWRTSYRNFYEPEQRWMFSGIRLAKDGHQ